MRTGRPKGKKPVGTSTRRDTTDDASPEPETGVTETVEPEGSSSAAPGRNTETTVNTVNTENTENTVNTANPAGGEKDVDVNASNGRDEERNPNEFEMSDVHSDDDDDFEPVDVPRSIASSSRSGRNGETWVDELGTLR